jgi:hypothetical protein
MKINKIKLSKQEMNINELNSFTKYGKINSPFEKDDKFFNTRKLLQYIPKGKWIKMEKIDGTNIRIILNKQDENKDREIFIGTRNLILNEEDKNSKYYIDCLKDVNLNKLKEYFKDIKPTIVIYGEGYGKGINKGGGYTQDKNYRIFDIKIGSAYQDFEYVKKVCVDNQLNIVPVISYDCVEVNYEECVLSLNKFENTLINEGEGKLPEGIIYKFEPVILNKYGERLIFKVKRKDFIEFKKL